MEQKQHKLHEVQTTRGALSYYIDSDFGGTVCMVNPQTNLRYYEIKTYHPRAIEYGVFFAFDDEQFINGYKDLINHGKIKDGDKVVSAGGGVYGTEKGLDAFFQAYKARDSKIARECDPQEVYFWEYNNHECFIGPHGDEPAYNVVKRIFGEGVANSIKRLQ